ncbi:sigma-70 family RNA polymerase sigma factor [Hylemonella sp. W303a]|uniref:sigma-70 family RNA polymerase sigma factor n=1 Tax=Hylemonella sp. W303a TaxID=3389873 RepID=UPI00396B3D70
MSSNPHTTVTAPLALTTLYEAHHGWLLGWLRRRLGCRNSAEDLAHDAWLRILAGRDFAAIVEPRAYLSNVAHGLMVNWLRRQALERAYLDALAALPEALAPSPEHRLSVLQTLHEVDAMLDGLPPQARQAFLLSQLDGLGYDEIAARLGVSLATVKRHMKRAFVGCLALMDDETVSTT